MGLSKNDQFIVYNKEQLLEANKQHPTPLPEKTIRTNKKYTKSRHKNLKQSNKKAYFCKEYKDEN